MSENENKTDSSTDHVEQDEHQEAAGRRKFLKGAVAASPVLMTVASKPVWAANCSLSGELSGNLSHHDNQPCDSQGCSPGYWGQHADITAIGTYGGWHEKYPPSMLFDEAFGRNVFYDKTLGEIAKLGDANTEWKRIEVNVNNCFEKRCRRMILQLAFQSVAALQNAATSVRFPYSVLGLDPEHPSVIVLFQDAWDSGDKSQIERLKNMFDLANNRGCPF